MCDSQFDENLVLETLSEHVLDKKEIATVSWLSKSEHISPNLARKCMEKFFSKNESQVKPIYCLSYMLDEKLKMTLSSKKSPDEINECEILSTQIFSLQSFQPRELSSICLPLQESLDYTKPGIKCPFDNISKNPKDQGLDPVPGSSKQSGQKVSSTLSSKPAVNTSKPKSGTVQSMFANTNSSQSTTKPKPTKSEPITKATKKVESKKQGSDIGKAFKGMETKPKVAKIEKLSPEKCNSETVPKRVADEETEERSPPKKKQKQPTGKHKRVIMDDSDEEEMNHSAANQNQEEESDVKSEQGDQSPLKENQEVEISEPEKVITKVRRRRKVLKDVTHVDEDGFLITDKVWQEESCSEEEDDSSSKTDKNGNLKTSSSNNASVKLPEMIFRNQPADDNNKPKPKTAKSGGGNAKKNQGSLFSFFGKKS